MTDEELKLQLAKLLPKKIYEHEGQVFWQGLKGFDEEVYCPVIDTEWLHVCWLVEQALSAIEYERWGKIMCDAAEKNQDTKTRQARDIASASWQQRAEALCQVKGL